MARPLTELSPENTKTGRLQREALRVVNEHIAAGMTPTSIRFIYYELEQAGIISKATSAASTGSVSIRRLRRDSRGSGRSSAQN
jgi:hypothetical protein